MKLYVKVTQKHAAHVSGSIEINEEELIKCLKNRGKEISVVCDDIASRGSCPRGNHSGKVFLKFIDFKPSTGF